MPLNETNIVWTDFTWNPVFGCSKVSAGCVNCYAAQLAYEEDWGPSTDHPWTAEHAAENVTERPGALDDLRGLPTESWVFVNSMSDLFNPEVSDSFVHEVLEQVAACESSAFQILTKHGPERDGFALDWLPRNAMLGVSVGHPRRLDRLDWLRDQPADTRFVSFEPLVAEISIADLDLTGVDWAIIGGESHEDADERREMEPWWARVLIRECWRQDVRVLFKQHSGPQPEGDTAIDPADGQGRREIREWPSTPHGVAGRPAKHRDDREDGGQAQLGEVSV
jgi:protein gp37